jgi:DNA-binding response OmpR family regulator
MKRSILLLDDEEPILFALSDFFTAEGWDVWAARELEEAEAVLALRSFDAAIVDLRLTGIGGTEGLRVLEMMHACYPRTKVVMLTAFGQASIEERARRLGARMVLHKPQPLWLIAEIMMQLVEEEYVLA